MELKYLNNTQQMDRTTENTVKSMISTTTNQPHNELILDKRERSKSKEVVFLLSWGIGRAMQQHHQWPRFSVQF
jgi:hypothetical protein